MVSGHQSWLNKGGSHGFAMFRGSFGGFLDFVFVLYCFRGIYISTDSSLSQPFERGRMDSSTCLAVAVWFIIREHERQESETTTNGVWKYP